VISNGFVNFFRVRKFLTNPADGLLRQILALGYFLLRPARHPHIKDTLAARFILVHRTSSRGEDATTKRRGVSVALNSPARCGGSHTAPRSHADRNRWVAAACLTRLNANLVSRKVHGALCHSAAPFLPVLATAPRLSIAFSAAETCVAIVASSLSIPFPAAINAAIACADSGVDALRTSSATRRGSSLLAKLLRRL
jgi:hypothetical protein